MLLCNHDMFQPMLLGHLEGELHTKPIRDQDVFTHFVL